MIPQPNPTSRHAGQRRTRHIGAGGRWALAIAIAASALLLRSDVARAAPSFTVNSNLDAIDANPGNGVCATSGGLCTLRAAVMEANHLTGGGATITLPGESALQCCYKLAIPASGSDDETTGNLNITANVTIVGAPNFLHPSVVIDGNGGVILDGVIAIDGGQVSMSGVTIENGQAVNGGGIFDQSTGPLNLTGVTITNNKALQGGGIFDTTGPVSIVNSTVSGNVAEGDQSSSGGGMYSSSSLTVTNTEISNNSATSRGGGVAGGAFSPVAMSGDTITGNTAAYGGGASLWSAAISDSDFSANQATSSGGAASLGGVVTVSNSTFAGNSSPAGGAIYIGGKTGTRSLNLMESLFSGNTAQNGGAIWAERQVDVSDTTISGNTASANGGGILVDGLLGESLSVLNSTISGNHASDGGGLYGVYGLSILTNSTVSGNSATDSGGGVYTATKHQTSLVNVTVANNSADSDMDSAGNGGGVWTGGQMAKLLIENTIVGGNFETHFQCDGQGCGLAVVPGDCSGPITSQGSNVVTHANVSYCTITGDPPMAVDVALGPLQDNGGPTETHALLDGSQAIDAGDPAGCKDSANATLTADQRGSPRPLDGNGDGSAVCDIGAFEHAAVATPTPSPSATGGSETPTPTASATVTATPKASAIESASPTASAISSAIPTPTPSAIRGDANCDGEVTAADADAALSQLAGVPPGAPCANRADLNCNGHLDSNDALRILAFKAEAPLTQPNGCPGLG